MKVVPVHPDIDRDAWLEHRRTGIGGSDIAAIIGVSPYKTPWQIYVDKVGLVDLDDQEDEQTEQMEWGQLLEQFILDRWEHTTGRHASFRQLLGRHDDHDWMLATFDGLETEGPGDPTGYGDPPEPEDVAMAIRPIEVKNITDWNWADGIPLHYQAQGQWQMMVSGLDSCLFVVLHAGRHLETYELEADPDDQAALLRAGEKFWRDHVEKEDPPFVLAADNAYMKRVYPDHDESEAIELEPAQADRLLKVRSQLADLNEEHDLLQAEIKQSLGEFRIGTVAGRKAVSWSTEGNDRVSTKLLKERYPDIAKEVTTKGKTKRVFRVHIDEVPEQEESYQ